MSVLLPIEKENKRKWDTLVSTKVHLPSYVLSDNQQYIRSPSKAREKKLGTGQKFERREAKF